MRTTRWASLVVLGLLLSGTWALAGDPKRSAPATAGRAAQGKKANPSWIVHGYGVTREDADRDAAENARVELMTYLTHQGLDLVYKPSLEFVQTAFIKEWVDDEQREVKGPGMVHDVSVRVELSPRDTREILRQDRQVRAQNRMLFLGKVLAGLVAFLAAVSGYFRLEEATKGYYTAWLRLAAIGFVAAVGTGLVLFM
jgi:hypothetical protein